MRELLKQTKVEISPQRKKLASACRRKHGLHDSPAVLAEPRAAKLPGVSEGSLPWGLIRPPEKREDTISGVI